MTATSVGLLLITVTACGGRTNAEMTVNAVTAERGSLRKKIDISGVLVPDRTVNIYSKLSGQAKTIAADIGDHVRAGEQLISIGTKELDAQLQVAKTAIASVEGQASQAKIGISTAKDNLDLAQKSFDRMSSLFQSSAVSQSQLDDARNKLELARAAYENAQKQYQLLSNSGLGQAQAQAHLLEVQISNSLIESPIDGIVTNRNINIGELVSPGVPLMTIADTSTLRLLGTVSQDDVPLLNIGRNVSFVIDGFPGDKVDGVITQIGPVAVSTGQYFPVIISFKNDGRFMAGMTGMAAIEVSGSSRVLAPLSAVLTTDGRSYVFVLKEGVVSRRAVTTGLKNTSETEIIDGLKAGEIIASSNVDLLSDGQQVKVVGK